MTTKRIYNWEYEKYKLLQDVKYQEKIAERFKTSVGEIHLHLLDFIKAMEATNGMPMFPKDIKTKLIEHLLKRIKA